MKTIKLTTEDNKLKMIKVINRFAKEYPNINSIMLRLAEAGHGNLYNRLTQDLSWSVKSTNNKAFDDNKVFINELERHIDLIIKLIKFTLKMNSKEYTDIIKSFITIEVLKKENIPFIAYNVDISPPAQDLVIIRDINDDNKLKITYYDLDYTSTLDYAKDIMKTAFKGIKNDVDIIDTILLDSNDAVDFYMNNDNYTEYVPDKLRLASNEISIIGTELQNCR